MEIETLEFDTKGDALSGFPPVTVEFEVSIEHTSDGAGEFMRDLVEHEVEIISINIDGDDRSDRMKTWFINSGDGNFKSFYDEIHERIDSTVEQDLWRYIND
jgi:hypothetical protein